MQLASLSCVVGCPCNLESMVLKVASSEIGKYLLRANTEYQTGEI